MTSWIILCISFYAFGAVNVRGSTKEVLESRGQASVDADVAALTFTARARAEGCNGLYSCLLSNLDERLDRVQNDRAYRFTKDLWLEKVRDRSVNVSVSETASYRRTFGGVVKKAMDLFKTHSLFWNFAPGLDLKVGNEDSGRFDATVQPSAIETRTFGFGMRRRLAFALLPIMYKMGVITTLLVGLTVFTLKGLTIGIILLFFTVTSAFHKFKTFGHNGYGGYGYPHPVPEKNVHIHIHSGAGGAGAHFEHGHPPSTSVHTGWERSPIPPVSGPDVHQYHHFSIDDTFKTTTGPYNYYYDK